MRASSQEILGGVVQLFDDATALDAELGLFDDRGLIVIGGWCL